MDVRLVARSLWVPVDPFRRVRGEVFDVSGEEGDRLIRLGAAVPADEVETVGQDEETDTDEVETVGQDEETFDPASESVGPERPKNAANKPTWEAYAKAKGVDPKGLDKDEIIAAVG